MNFIISITIFFLSASLSAADCKYFKEHFFGNLKVLNYDCQSNTESEYFKCYSDNDPYVSVSAMQISPVAMGVGIALSVKKIDRDLNVIDELFFSEYNLQKNETLKCSEVDENGVKFQIMKQQLVGEGNAIIYSMLTKRNASMELEMFSSLGGVTTKQIFMMELNFY